MIPGLDGFHALARFLYHARTLVTQHHGTISVTSHDGKGTVFTIELPASGGPADPSGAGRNEHTIQV